MSSWYKQDNVIVIEISGFLYRSILQVINTGHLERALNIKGPDFFESRFT